MAILTQQFCATWREKIGTIDPCEPDARQRLNTAYSTLVQELRTHYQAATFNAPCPSLDPERAKHASDPDLSLNELFELITHYPAEVTTNPVWELLALAGSPLVDEDGNQPSEEQLAPLAQLPNLWQHVRNQCPDGHYNRLKLSYTAVLDAKEHPFHTHTQLIKDLYSVENNLEEAQEAWLAEQFNKLFREEFPQSIRATLECANIYDAALPVGLDRSLVYEVVNALLPVYFEHNHSLFWLSLFSSTFLEHDEHEPCFMDASPVDDLTLKVVGQESSYRTEAHPKRAVLDAIINLLEAHQHASEALRLLLNAVVFAARPLNPSVLRLHMIKERSANHDLLMAASWSWHWQERLAVARSPFAPQQALEKLCRDGLPFIRHVASQTRSHKITT
jgi:hypothetical protein